MTLNHIQLDSDNVEPQLSFYEKYFGFRRAPFKGGWFLRNRSGFMIAVNPIDEKPIVPAWFHIGFRQSSKDEVIAFRERFAKDGFDVSPIDDWGDYMQFRFPDPTGYVVEIYWDLTPPFL